MKHSAITEHHLYNKVFQRGERFVGKYVTVHILTDYAAKRNNNFTLLPPTVTRVAPDTFEGLLREEGRLGGQIKIPRLNGERTYVERLKAFAQKHQDSITDN
jgi:hypothetical protein